jgi:hypothetical protein
MRVRLALIPLVAVAALLGGCATTTGTPNATPTTTGPVDNGVAALSATDIQAKAQAALAAAKSYHLAGKLVRQGNLATVDLKFAGKNGTGTVEVSGAQLNVVLVGTDLYLKAPDAYWSAIVPPALSATVLPLLKGKYVKLDGSNPTYSAQTDPYKPENLTKLNGTLTKGDTKTIGTVPAIAVVDADGTKLYVATVGDPVPLSIEDAKGNVATFTEYNADVTVTAPATADVLDLKALMGG